MEGSVVDCAGCVVHVDVHGEWVMLWVAAMYNVVVILSMAGMVCLAHIQKLCSARVCMVCMVCNGILSVWCVGLKLCLLQLNMADMDQWKTVELVLRLFSDMNWLSAFREFSRVQKLYCC